MNAQKKELSNREISERELEIKELDGVSGGMRNNETQAWQAFMKGFDKGWTESGGSILYQRSLGSTHMRPGTGSD